MNNKMAINTHLSTIECKKQTKQTKRTEIESWTQMVARQEGCRGMGKEVRGLKVQIGSYRIAIEM